MSDEEEFIRRALQQRQARRARTARLAAEVLELRAKGNTNRQIEELLGLSRAAVTHRLATARRIGLDVPDGRSGR